MFAAVGIQLEAATPWNVAAAGTDTTVLPPTGQFTLHWKKVVAEMPVNVYAGAIAPDIAVHGPPAVGADAHW